MCSKVIPLTEIEQLPQFFANWQGQLDQVSAGRFGGRLRVARGSCLRVAAVEFNQRVAFRGRDVSGLTAIYPVIGRGAANAWQGSLLRPGQILVGGSDQEINHCSLRQSSDWGLHLRAETLADAARSLCDSDRVVLPCTGTVCSVPPDAIAELTRPLNRMLDMGLADTAFLRSPEGHRLEQECLRGLAHALMWPAGPPERLTPPARSQLVARADDFLRARLGESVGMIDLCGAISASDRTLRFAFRERYGVGPMTFFRILRLNAVRTRLRNDSLLTIADTAREYGFRHLGNFAGHYRRLFGEHPSTTPRGT